MLICGRDKHFTHTLSHFNDSFINYELFPPILLAKKTEAQRSQRKKKKTTPKKIQVIKANVTLVLLVSTSGLRQITEALCKPQCPLV